MQALDRLGALACLMAVCACAPASPRPPAVNTAKIVDTIQTLEAHSNQDWAAKDLDKVTAFFAPNAIIMQAGAPTLTGGRAIRAGLAQIMADPGFSLTFASDKVYVATSGDLAVARGAYTQTETNPKTKAVVTTTGRYVTVFKPQPDGNWKGVWDIVAPNPAPIAGAAPAKQ